MLKYNSFFKQKVDKLFRPVADVIYRRWGVTPDVLTWLSFLIANGAVISIVLGRVGMGMTLLTLAMVLDGLDGMVARNFGLESDKGEWLDAILDTVNEICLFLVLPLVGLAAWKLGFLASVAVVLVRILRKKAKFDPWFKRMVLVFGFFTSFDLALTIIFGANLLGFAVQMLIIDYRYQRLLDSRN